MSFLNYIISNLLMTRVCLCLIYDYVSVFHELASAIYSLYTSIWSISPLIRFDKIRPHVWQIISLIYGVNLPLTIRTLFNDYEIS